VSTRKIPFYERAYPVEEAIRRCRRCAWLILPGARPDGGCRRLV